jgi:hypothetical protein
MQRGERARFSCARARNARARSTRTRARARKIVRARATCFHKKSEILRARAQRARNARDPRSLYFMRLLSFKSKFMWLQYITWLIMSLDKQNIYKILNCKFLLFSRFYLTCNVLYSPFQTLAWPPDHSIIAICGCHCRSSAGEHPLLNWKRSFRFRLCWGNVKHRQWASHPLMGSFTLRTEKYIHII